MTAPKSRYPSVAAYRKRGGMVRFEVLVPDWLHDEIQKWAARAEISKGDFVKSCVIACLQTKTAATARQR